MRTIRVRDDVYERLEALKRSDETVPDLVDRLTDRDAQFERGFGAFSDVDGALEALYEHGSREQLRDVSDRG